MSLNAALARRSRRRISGESFAGMRRLLVAAFASEYPSRSVLRPQPFGPPLHFAESPSVVHFSACPDGYPADKQSTHEARNKAPGPTTSCGTRS
jgi:hypothetical protein